MSQLKVHEIKPVAVTLKWRNCCGYEVETVYKCVVAFQDWSDNILFTSGAT